MFLNASKEKVLVWIFSSMDYQWDFHIPRFQVRVAKTYLIIQKFSHDLIHKIHLNWSLRLFYKVLQKNTPSNRVFNSLYSYE